MINRRCYRLRLFRWLESLPWRHTIQPRRAGRTARPSPSASVPAPPGAGGVRALGRPAHETDRRSGLTIDDRQGGRYLGIPPQSSIAPPTITPASTAAGPIYNGATARSLLASPGYLTAEVISTGWASAAARFLRCRLHAHVGQPPYAAVVSALAACWPTRTFLLRQTRAGSGPAKNLHGRHQGS